MNDKFVIGSRC